MRELGCASHPAYRLVCYLDHKAMVTCRTEKYGMPAISSHSTPGPDHRAHFMRCPGLERSRVAACVAQDPTWLPHLRLFTHQ